MAARGRILATIFLSFTILPLLSTAIFPFREHSRGIIFPGLDLGKISHNHDHSHYDHDHEHDHFIGFRKKKDKGEEEDDSLPIFDGKKGNEDDDEPEHEKKKKPEDEKQKPDKGQGGYGGQVPEKQKPDEGKEGSDEQDQEPEEPVDGSGDGAINEPVQKQEGLREGFYEKSCPQAENVVKEVIKKIFRKDPTLAPALVRLFLHDCFVTVRKKKLLYPILTSKLLKQGCDASILLDETPTGEEVEKKAHVNGPFVRGYEAIDEIKAQLEAECPETVSCADILAFTNRDALVHAGVPSYSVPAGRRDSLASLSNNVQGNLPVPETPINEITQIFEKKGFSMEDLVVLNGAHSIGTAHCTVVSGRFFDPEKSKEIDQGYVIKMRPLAMCRNETQDLPFDPYSHHKMDSRFYKELLQNRALLESDHNLAKDGHANEIMKKLVDDQKGWLEKFTKAIVKLGEVEVLTGDQGQIRKQCRAVNG
ncbi:hypothetical protein BUALT_Bualt05G0162300 [Buddleja alternifolia]|uniref:peroxidase n=1 Tax=Buddleja alternifolia TaxID=168488 RepID=A0AAV6XP12_9LAMI|nr:hypothetical protein BUALT_Bualt05G0162300 [Buddleja alternifolia]